MLQRIVLAAVLVAGMAGALIANQSEQQTSFAAAPKGLSDLYSQGTHWFGEEFDVKDLRGRVVLIEDWGYN